MEYEVVDLINEFYDYDETKDVDIEIQCKRILYILDETLDHIRIMARFPYTIRDGGKRLFYYLSENQAAFILNICAKFTNLDRALASTCDNAIANAIEKVASPHVHQQSSTMENSEHHYMAQVIDLIKTNQPLKEMLLKSECSIDPNYKFFTNLIEKLRNITAKRIEIDSEKESKRTGDLEVAYRSNPILTENLEKLKEQLELQRKTLGAENAQKLKQIAILEEQLKRLQIQYDGEAKRIVEESEKIVVETTTKSEINQTELSLEAKTTTEQYNSLLETHLHMEKSLRAKVNKTEAQLASWLAKFDADIGERQTEIENLQKAFDDEREEMQQLQEEFDEQELEYVILMEEKAEEERRIFEEKLLIFVMNRSARIIQKAWRNYKERKRQRKKGKKGKGKGKGKKSKKDDKVAIKGGPDPNALLKDQFDDDIMGSIDPEMGFDQKNVVVEL